MVKELAYDEITVTWKMPPRKQQAAGREATPLEIGHASDIIQKRRRGGDSFETSVAASQRMRWWA